MIWSDFGQLTGAILLMVGALLPVVNPLGDAPIFLRMTPGCDEPTRADLAIRIAFFSFILLLEAMLLGSFVLRLFGLSISIVQVAGGAAVCALGPYEWVAAYADGMRAAYTEATAWQYTWFVPQDVPGLIALMGGQGARQLTSFLPKAAFTEVEDRK
jgi:small neutral amino acid transporter SnatA (MarC family)